MDYLSGVSFPLYFWYDREYEVVDLNVLNHLLNIGSHQVSLNKINFSSRVHGRPKQFYTF